MPAPAAIIAHRVRRVAVVFFTFFMLQLLHLATAQSTTILLQQDVECGSMNNPQAFAGHTENNDLPGCESTAMVLKLPYISYNPTTRICKLSSYCYQIANSTGTNIYLTGGYKDIWGDGNLLSCQEPSYANTLDTPDVCSQRCVADSACTYWGYSAPGCDFYSNCTINATVKTSLIVRTKVPVCVPSCPTNATCVDGMCVCPTGYNYNATACADTNECTANTHTCTSPQTTCQNTIGSFSCICNLTYDGLGGLCSPFLLSDSATCTDLSTSFATYGFIDWGTCRNICQYLTSCHVFTYNNVTQTCILWKSCYELKPDAAQLWAVPAFKSSASLRCTITHSVVQVATGYACAESCKADDKCTAISYDYNSRNCFRASVCSKQTIAPTASANATVPYPIRQQHLALFSGYSGCGFLLSNQINVTKWSDCVSLCRQTNGCQVATYFNDTLTCTLHTVCLNPSTVTPGATIYAMPTAAGNVSNTCAPPTDLESVSTPTLAECAAQAPTQASYVVYDFGNNNCASFATCTPRTVLPTSTDPVPSTRLFVIRPDTNECTSGTHTCMSPSACVNVYGSFSCSCPSGYTNTTATSTQCADVNECAANSRICGSNTSCTNSIGSFSCACMPGFADQNGDCVDIDECAANATICGNNAGCTNTNGAYSCQCNTGYTLDNGVCVAGDQSGTGPPASSTQSEPTPYSTTSHPAPTTANQDSTWASTASSTQSNPASSSTISQPAPTATNQELASAPPKQNNATCFNATGPFQARMVNADTTSPLAAQAVSLFGPGGGYCLTLTSPSSGAHLYSCTLPPGLTPPAAATALTVGSNGSLVVLRGTMYRCRAGTGLRQCADQLSTGHGVCMVSIGYHVQAVGGALVGAGPEAIAAGSVIRCGDESLHLLHGSNTTAHQIAVRGGVPAQYGAHGIGWTTQEGLDTGHFEWMFGLDC